MWTLPHSPFIITANYGKSRTGFISPLLPHFLTAFCLSLFCPMFPYFVPKNRFIFPYFVLDVPYFVLGTYFNVLRDRPLHGLLATFSPSYMLA